MKTKLLSVILVILCIFAIGIFTDEGLKIPVTLTADALTEGNFTYTVSDGMATVTGYPKNVIGAVVIPATLGGYPVIAIGAGAFFNCTGLTSIEIPDSVTSIGASAFYNTAYYNNTANWTDNVLYVGNYLIEAKTDICGKYKIKDGTKVIAPSAFSECYGLTSIEIPDSVTSIGYSAFHQCCGLTSIEIPGSVTSIDNYAFSDCTGLTSIKIPDSVTSIGYSAFHQCCGLTSIEIPDSVTSIGFSAFSDCTGLTSIKIPDSVASIGASAFSGCTGLTSIEIPDSVTSIGKSAFSKCYGLTSIEIPDSVTSIGDNAFVGVTNVMYSGAATGSPWGAKIINGYIEDGIVYKDSGKTLLMRCPISIEGTVTIPDTVTEIGDKAFEDCAGLTSIEIPDSVTSIGSSAFACCENLESVALSANLKYIGSFAFASCRISTPITIPAGVTKIGEGAFMVSGISELKIDRDNKEYHIDGNCLIETKSKTLLCCFKNGVIPDDGSVTSIGTYAFSNCNHVESITLPASITSIDFGAFECICFRYAIIIDYGVLNVTEGSYAESFAQQQHYKYISCHNLSKTAAKAATCDNVGNNEYYTCSVCKKVFKDAKGTTETTVENETLAKIEITYILADVNGDGAITAGDARLALRASVGLENYKNESREFKSADINKDGFIRADDARIILRAAVKLEDPKKW